MKIIAAVVLLSTLNPSLSSCFAQGSLTPPGAPAPTFKTLDQVEPRIAITASNTPGDADSLFKITQPGSYYLTGNITGVANKHGIEIAASGVTLDLNGFDLLGAPGSLDGVSVTTAAIQSNIAVVNGSVRVWGDKGIDLSTFGAINCRVERVLAAFNAGDGISTGTDSTVLDCSAYQNSGNGISGGNGGTVSNCSAAFNGAAGIRTGEGCAVSKCSASHNTNNGIVPGIGCTVSNCSASQNGGIGIDAGFGCTVTNCSAYLNAADGISTTAGSTVADCTARFNTLDGIVCFSDCVIRGNTCSLNGSGGDGAGIHATSSNNRIEGNNCTGADRGIDVDAAGNFISRNICSGNTNNWDVVAGNVILVVNATIAAAVTGNSGGAAPGSTDPNANFTY